jgi:hypothetical protein
MVSVKGRIMLSFCSFLVLYHVEREIHPYIIATMRRKKRRRSNEWHICHYFSYKEGESHTLQWNIIHGNHLLNLQYLDDSHPKD